MWNFKQYGDTTALVSEGGGMLTYNQLDELADELARRIGHRCLTFVMCTNTTGSLLGYASFLTHNIVPVMVEASLDRQLLDKLIVTYQPDYLWCPESMRTEFRAVTQVGNAQLEYVLLKTEYSSSFRMHEDLGLLLTTSGSTGSPKLVRQSYANLQANTQSIVEYLHIDSSERAITTLPMNYTYGLSIVNTHLYAGASIVLTDRSLMQKEFWQQFREMQVTSFGGVPYTYEMLQKLRFFRMDLPALRYMTQAGGKLSPELHKAFAEYAIAQNKRFIVMYGQTEATARMSYLPADRSLEKYGSMGVAIPGGRFELIDVEGVPIIDADTIGELVYYGDNVTMGYAEQGEDLSKGDERHGVLITGDMAKRDTDGYYYIVGRKKRFLKIFGSRVNLDEVERLLRAEFPETDCISGGVDDRIFIFNTQEAWNKKLKHFLCEKTGINPVAVKIVTISEIPRNESGKILYKELEGYYG